MATTTSSVHAHNIPLDSPAIFVAESLKRRAIDPRSGEALVILSHAIEYLTDELIQEGGLSAANHGQVNAIQLLMAINREIYFACPEAPTFMQWLCSGTSRLLERTEP